MHADVTGLPVIIGEFDNCAVLGAGILAAAGSGFYNNQHHQEVQKHSNIDSSNRYSDGQHKTPDSKSTLSYDKLTNDIHHLVNITINKMVRTAKRIEPNMKKHKLYSHYFAIYKQMSKVIEPISHQLATSTAINSMLSSSTNNNFFNHLNPFYKNKADNNNHATTALTKKDESALSSSSSLSQNALILSKPIFKRNLHKYKLKYKKYIEIVPSILSADYSALAENIQICYNNDVKWIHVDICDGVATPGSLTFGPKHVADLKQKFPD